MLQQRRARLSCLQQAVQSLTFIFQSTLERLSWLLFKMPDVSHDFWRPVLVDYKLQRAAWRSARLYRAWASSVWVSGNSCYTRDCPTPFSSSLIQTFFCFISPSYLKLISSTHAGQAYSQARDGTEYHVCPLSSMHTTVEPSPRPIEKS